MGGSQDEAHRLWPHKAAQINTCPPDVCSSNFCLYVCSPVTLINSGKRFCTSTPELRLSVVCSYLSVGAVVVRLQVPMVESSAILFSSSCILGPQSLQLFCHLLAEEGTPLGHLGGGAAVDRDT